MACTKQPAHMIKPQRNKGWRQKATWFEPWSYEMTCMSNDKKDERPREMLLLQNLQHPH